jgi:hypothetical protein
LVYITSFRLSILTKVFLLNSCKVTRFRRKPTSFGDVGFLRKAEPGSLMSWMNIHVIISDDCMN